MITGFDGVICGVFGGYCDMVVVVNLLIIVVFLVCGCILIVVEKVINVIILGFIIDVLVMD